MSFSGTKVYALTFRRTFKRGVCLFTLCELVI